jgi:RNA polymerase sigma-70 factor (ECF subfamily)
MGDEELVNRVLAGETAAYADLVCRHRRAALARALAVVGEPADADDVAQDAFVQAYDQLATCRNRARFGAWLLTIVHRRALNHLRTVRRRRAVPLDDALPAPNDAHLVRAERDDLRRRLLDALATLPAVQREVVLLADVEHRSHAEIAATTGLSVTMSRRHLSDARRRLRALLTSA